MKKFLLLIIVVMGFTIESKTQNGYQIIGKANELSDGTIFLLTNENGETDTLNMTQIKNGVFMFEGKVSTPIAAYIRKANEERMIPLILENVPFTINIGSTGILIQGGEQQEIFSQFNRIGIHLLKEQECIQKKYKQAEQIGNKSEMLLLRKQFEEIIAEARQEDEALRKKYSNMYVTAYVVTLGMRGDSEECLREKYEALGEKARATIPGKRIAGVLNRYAILAEGKEIPNLTLGKPDGNAFTLHEVSAKLKLFYFWESSNAVSRQFVPELLKLYLQYRPLGLEIIAISLDENISHWRHAIGQDGMIWTNGSDLKGKNSGVADLYMVNDLPYTILVNADNRIIAKGLLGEELYRRVEEILRKRQKK